MTQTQTGDTPKHTRRLPPSDYRAVLRLERRATEAVEIRERYAAGQVAITAQAQGYAFQWGALTERLAGTALVFDFHLADMQAECERHGIRATAMQERVFALLEEISDYAVRDNASACDMARGWKIVPAAIGKASAFTILCSLADEQELRQWLIAEFILETLPLLHQRIYDELDA